MGGILSSFFDSISSYIEGIGSAVAKAWDNFISAIKVQLAGPNATPECVANFSFGEVVTFAIHRWFVAAAEVGSEVGAIIIGTLGALSTGFGIWNIVGGYHRFLSFRVITEFILGLPLLYGAYRLYSYSQSPLPILCPPTTTPRGWLTVIGIPSIQAFPSIVFPSVVKTMDPLSTCQFGVDAAGAQPCEVLYSNPNWVQRSPQSIGQPNYGVQYVQIINTPFKTPSIKPDPRTKRVVTFQQPIYTDNTNADNPFYSFPTYLFAYDPDLNGIYLLLEDGTFTSLNQSGASPVKNAYSESDTNCNITILYWGGGMSVWFEKSLDQIVGQAPNLLVPPMVGAPGNVWSGWAPFGIYEILYPTSNTYYGLVFGDAIVGSTTYNYSLTGTLGAMAALTQARSDLVTIPTVPQVIAPVTPQALIQAAVVNGNYGPNGLPGQLQYVPNASIFPCPPNSQFFPPYPYTGPVVNSPTTGIPCLPYGPTGSLQTFSLMHFFSNVPQGYWGTGPGLGNYATIDSFMFQPDGIVDEVFAANTKRPPVGPDPSRVVYTLIDPDYFTGGNSTQSSRTMVPWYSGGMVRYTSARLWFKPWVFTSPIQAAGYAPSIYAVQFVIELLREDGKSFSTSCDPVTGNIGLVPGAPQQDSNYNYIGAMYAGYCQAVSANGSPTQLDWAFTINCTGDASNGWVTMSPWPYGAPVQCPVLGVDACLGPIERPFPNLTATTVNQGTVPVVEINNIKMLAYQVQLLLVNPQLATA